MLLLVLCCIVIFVFYVICFNFFSTLLLFTVLDVSQRAHPSPTSHFPQVVGRSIIHYTISLPNRSIGSSTCRLQLPSFCLEN